MHVKLPFILVISLLSCTAFTGVNEALACTYAATPRFELDNTKKDLPVPKQVTVSVGGIRRGAGPDNGAASSCDDSGSISMTVTPVEECVGYIFEVVEGEAPAELFGSSGEYPIRPFNNDGMSPMFSLRWNDGAQDEQEELDFKVAVTPINCAGVKGPQSDPVRVYHPGVEADDGCSQTGSRAPASMLWFVALAGVVLWRRRKHA